MSRQREWENIKPGWHELIIKIDKESSIKIIRDWITANIQKPERHCLILYGTNKVRIKFRYERDYILARLRW